MILFLGMSCHFSGWADETESLWPEPVYFPQRSDQPTTTPLLPTDKKSTDKKSGKRLWLFGGKNDNSKIPQPSMEQILQVGAKEPVASPYPLLRLPMPIETGQGLILPGIYLLKPAYASPAVPTATSKDTRVLILSQRNQDVLQFSVRTKPSEDPNLVTEGTPSPLSKVTPKTVTPFKAEARISADHRSLIIQLKGGDQTFESEAFPIATDRHHLLTY